MADRREWDAVRECGSFAEASRRLGLPLSTLKDRARNASSAFNLPHPLAREVVTKNFTSYHPPEKERSLEELLQARREESLRSQDNYDAKNIIHIKIHTPGPIGIMVFGDPHVDSPDCAFDLLQDHLALINGRQHYIFCGNIGDVQDNWIGRLSHLKGKSETTSKEAWKLVRWLMTEIEWTWLIRGNHDCWSGDNDPLTWIMESSPGTVDEAHGIRLSFDHPCGASTRVHARHDFPGSSIYNPLHALKRELLHAHRDHIVVAGHRHIGADAGDFIGDMAVQMVRVGGYKRYDSFRFQIGAYARPIHPAALIAVDPSESDSSRARAWCAPTIEKGIEYLDMVRAKYEGREI